MARRLYGNAVRILAVALAAGLLGEAAWAVDAPDTLGPWNVGHRRTFAMPPHVSGTSFIELWYPTDDTTGTLTEYFLANMSFAILNVDSTVAFEDAGVASGSFPLIAFSHGSGGIPNQSIEVCEALASHGFIVIAAEHINNTFIGPSQPGSVTARQRPKDVSWMIDYMLARSADGGDDFSGSIDSSKIGVSGHSFGGFTTYAMASGFTNAFCDTNATDYGSTCTLDTDCDCGGACPVGTCSHETVAADARVDVLVPISPAHEFFSDAELESITLPTLCMAGTAEAASTRCNRPFPLTQENASPNYRADVIGASHTAFASICPIGFALIDSGICPSLAAPPVDGVCEDPTDPSPPSGLDYTDPAVYTAWAALGAGALTGPFIETCVIPLIPRSEVVRLQSLYTISMFRRHLLGETGYDAYLTQAYAATEPDITFFSGLISLPVLSTGGAALLAGLLSGADRASARFHSS
jgi:predicted dienelactone hydrolase